MKNFLSIVKISVAIVLLVASGYTLYNSLIDDRNTSVAHFIGVFLGLSIVVFPAAWLLRSGFTNNKSKNTYLKYLLVSFALVGIFSFFNWWEKTSSNQFYENDEVKIPLRDCIVGDKAFISDFDERKKFCSCIAETLVNNKEVYEKYREKLLKGELSIVYSEIANGTGSIFEKYPCLSDVKTANWITEIEDGFSNSIRAEVKKYSFGDTTNNDAYCNCVLREIKKFNVVDVIKKDIPTDSLVKVCRLEVFDIEIEYK